MELRAIPTDQATPTDQGTIDAAINAFAVAVVKPLESLTTVFLACSTGSILLGLSGQVEWENIACVLGLAYPFYGSILALATDKAAHRMCCTCGRRYRWGARLLVASGMVVVWLPVSVGIFFAAIFWRNRR